MMRAHRWMDCRLALVFLAFLWIGAPEPIRGEEEFNLADHVTFSASNRMRGEFVSWFDPGAPNRNATHNFFANRARVGITLSFPTVEFFVEAQDTRLVNLPGADSINASAGPLGPGALYFANTHKRDQGETILHRGYATFRQFGLPGVGFSVGRLGYNHGLEKVSEDPTLAWLQKNRISQRLIGNFDYTNVGRSFDGVVLKVDHGALNWTTLVSHPTFGGFEVSANRQISDIDLISSTASIVAPGTLGPYSAQVFYIYYGDRRDLLATDNRPKAPPSGSCTGVTDTSAFRSCDGDDITISTVGGNIVQTAKLGPGTAEGVVWAAAQFGDWESLDHQGWAYATEAGYRLDDVPLQPWLRVGFFRSSGDQDGTDGRHRTFFQLIPTARLYADFPFFNMMNNQDLFVQGILKPIGAATLAVSGHWLRATEGADLWYAGGGATSDTFFGYSGNPAGGRRELAYLLDGSLTYQVTKWLQVHGYWGWAFGQGVVSNSFVGNDAYYGFLEFTVSY